MRRRGAVPAAAALVAVIAAAGASSSLAVGDSARFVYETSSSGPPFVWVARTDGGGARRVAGGESPHVSPDGGTVAYGATSRSGFELIMTPAAGGRARVLLDSWWTAEGTFAWSPDSKTIAAVSGRGSGRTRLLLIDVAGGRGRVGATGWFFGASFAPAGDRLVYGAATSRDDPLEAGLFTVPVSGGAPTRLTKVGASAYPLWGPASIVFARLQKPMRSNDSPNQNLYLIEPSGGNERQLTHQRVGYLLAGLVPRAWSADGRRLLAEFGGQDTSYAETVDPRSGRVRAFRGIVGFALSRDGSTILGATGGFEPGMAPNNVVTVPYAGGSPHVLARGAFYSDWNR
jgi:WD40-like Beta Propeller Repeat